MTKIARNIDNVICMENLKSLYDEAILVGFTPEQALYLIGKMIEVVSQKH